MTHIDLFKVGLVDYKDKGLTKPVKFTKEDLKEIANNTETIKLTNEHTTNEIGEISNFIFEENTLKVEKPTMIELEGKGISPVFKCDFRDMGDYYKPINLQLVEAGLTTSPRSGILYNNIKGDTKMSDNLRELLDKKEERVIEQQEEIALLKKQLEETKQILNDGLSDNKKIQEQLKTVQEELENAKTYQADAEKLRTQEAEAKEQLIKEIAGENDATYLNKLSYDDLVQMKEATIINEPMKGQTTQAEGLDSEGDLPQEEDEVDPYSYDSFLKWDEENSSWGNSIEFNN